MVTGFIDDEYWGCNGNVGKRVDVRQSEGKNLKGSDFLEVKLKTTIKCTKEMDSRMLLRALGRQGEEWGLLRAVGRSSTQGESRGRQGQLKVSLGGKPNVTQNKYKLTLGTLVGLSRRVKRWSERLGKTTLKSKSPV